MAAVEQVRGGLARLVEVENLLNDAFFAGDLFLQHHDRVDQLFRARRATGDVDVDRDHLVDGRITYINSINRDSNDLNQLIINH